MEKCTTDDGESVPCLDEHHFHPDASNVTHLSWRKRLVPSMNLGGMIFTIALSAAMVWATMRVERGDSNAPRFRPQWSPLYDQIKILVIEKTLELFIPWRPDHPENIYARDASPEVDAAWEEISHSMTFIPVSAEDVVRMGKDPEALVKIPDGMGHDGKFLATEDTLHQVHCLNYLRKGLIHSYDYYWGKKWGFWPPFSMVRHMTHDVDILRQHIMCNADFELYTYNWRVGETIKWPDFGVKKTCHDFGTLLNHLKTTQQSDLARLYRNITKPDGANELPVPLGVWEYIQDETFVNEAGTYLNPLPGLGDTDYCLS